MKKRGGKLCFYTQDDQLIAMHDLSLDTGKTIKNSDHAREKSKTRQKTYELVLESLRDIPRAEQYLAELESDKPRYFHDNLRAIQKSLYNRPEGAIAPAISYCLDNRMLNANRFAKVVDHFEKEQGKAAPKHNICVATDTCGAIPLERMEPQKSSINDYESIMK